MRTTLTLLAIVVSLLLASAVRAEDMQVVKSEPAWCGGSWQPTSLQELSDDKGNATLVPVAGTGGTNFGPCLSVVRPVKRMVEGAEKEDLLAVPTYPAHPATLVTFQRDEKTGELVTGSIVSRKDAKSGEDVARWEPIAPVVIKAAK